MSAKNPNDGTVSKMKLKLSIRDHAKSEKRRDRQVARLEARIENIEQTLRSYFGDNLKRRK